MNQEDLYQTVLFGAKKLNKDHRLDLILNLVPDDKKMVVLEALGYQISVLNPDRDFSRTQGKFEITDEIDKLIEEPSVEEV